MDNTGFIHRWANDNLNNKTRCGNLSVRDGVLYSYNQPIANRIGEDVFITSKTWSKTTSRHTGIASDATSNRRRICVPNIIDPGEQGRAEANMKHLKEVVDSSKLAYERARTLSTQKLVSYKRSLQELLNFMHFTNHDAVEGVVLTLENVREQAYKVEAKIRESHAKQEAKRVQKWLDGARDVRLTTSVDAEGFVHLRALTASDDENKPVEVETSRGARVPWSDAVRLFRLARKALETGTSFVPAVTIDVGGYRLNEIEPSGNVTVGCHKISFASMDAIARRFSTHLNV